MRLLALAAAALPILAAASGPASDAASSTASASDLSTTIYYWPLQAASPAVLAEVTYDPTTLAYTLDKYNSPIESSASASGSNEESLLRIGLYDPSTKSWNGAVTKSSSFADIYSKTLTLSLDAEGNVWHVGFRAGKSSAGKVEGEDEETGTGTGTGTGTEAKQGVKVELVKPAKGPEPHLNKPVVLSADGKLPQKEPEKTILQKYWWVFLAVTLLLMAGGGDK